eukprot:7161206-Pyramimonas_sp.AAC.1
MLSPSSRIELKDKGAPQTSGVVFLCATHLAAPMNSRRDLQDELCSAARCLFPGPYTAPSRPET